jgi:hypothetical protein
MPPPPDYPGSGNGRPVRQEWLETSHDGGWHEQPPWEGEFADSTPDLRYGEPGPGYGGPDLGYGEPDPRYREPGPGYGEPGPGYGGPDLGYGEPDPRYREPDLRYGEPGPGMPGYQGSREHRYGGDRY